MALYADRTDAGRQLAELLTTWENRDAAADAVVLGLPRGGVVVAAEVAARLNLPLGAIAVRKLGSPGREEFAVGAIAGDARVVDADALRAGGVSAAQLDAVESRERAELRRRAALFAGGPTPAGRRALVVDDGIATGATATAACRAVRAAGATAVVLAVPVAPQRWRPEPGLVDAYVCAHPQAEFWAVGRFYADFTQTTDAEVVALLSGGPGGADGAQP